MDRRFEQRYQTDLDVTVTAIDAPERVAKGRVVDISESGVCAALPLRFEPGTSIKAQVENNTLFGYVAYCEGEQPFRTGIEVVRVLVGESDLSRLVRAVQAEGGLPVEVK